MSTCSQFAKEYINLTKNPLDTYLDVINISSSDDSNFCRPKIENFRIGFDIVIHFY